MAHLGTIHSRRRDHAAIMFSSGCCTLQRSQKNWKAFRGKRPRQGKDQKQTNEDLDVFSLQKRGF